MPHAETAGLPLPVTTAYHRCLQIFLKAAGGIEEAVGCCMRIGLWYTEGQGIKSTEHVVRNMGYGVRSREQEAGNKKQRVRSRE